MPAASVSDSVGHDSIGRASASSFSYSSAPAGTCALGVSFMTMTCSTVVSRLRIGSSVGQHEASTMRILSPAWLTM